MDRTASCIPAEVFCPRAHSRPGRLGVTCRGSQATACRAWRARPLLCSLPPHLAMLGSPPPRTSGSQGNPCRVSGAASRESPGFGTGHHLLQNLPLPLTGCALGRVLAPHPRPQFLHADTRDGLPLPPPLGCSEDVVMEVTAHSKRLTNGRCSPLVPHCERGCHVGDLLSAALGAVDLPWSPPPSKVFVDKACLVCPKQVG